MNTYRNYNNNTSALSKNLEKLSSGYKINRAGDDAAGLDISEKMRAQITGLNAAQKNVKDGISLVKTAEGAMQEIQDMLNRMDYLATQFANGTYDNEVDRANLQKEVDALKTEINRIADSANFNGIKLLDGSLDKDAKIVTETTGGDTITTYGIKDEGTFAAYGNRAEGATGTNGPQLHKELGGDIEAITRAITRLTERASGNEMWDVQQSYGHWDIALTERVDFADSNTDNSKADLTTAQGIKDTIHKFTFEKTVETTEEVATTTGTKNGKPLTLQIGDTSDSFNQMKASIGDMHVGAMFGLKRDADGNLEKDDEGNTVKDTSKSIASISVADQDKAAEAVNVIKDAINYVSSIRGDLGAIQNRLEHTQNNLSVMAKNIQDAESTIRDTDMAEEMMGHVKNNILVQSAQAMLAQANQVPQGVLQLLG